MKQKQKQTQSVKVIVNLAERRKRRRKTRRISKVGAPVKRPIQSTPNINISSSYQQAPIIPNYPRYINAPTPAQQPYSIQELRKAFLENMGQQTPSAEPTPPTPTPIETPAVKPVSVKEDPIEAPSTVKEEPRDNAPAPTPRDPPPSVSKPKRRMGEVEEAFSMGAEDPNPLHRNKSDLLEEARSRRRARTTERALLSPLTNRSKDNYSDFGKSL